MLRRRTTRHSSASAHGRIGEQAAAAAACHYRVEAWRAPPLASPQGAAVEAVLDTPSSARKQAGADASSRRAATAGAASPTETNDVGFAGRQAGRQAQTPTLLRCFACVPTAREAAAALKAVPCTMLERCRPNSGAKEPEPGPTAVSVSDGRKCTTPSTSARERHRRPNRWRTPSPRHRTESWTCSRPRAP